MAEIGLIGMGNMGSAVMKALVEKKGAEKLLFSCRTKEHGERVSGETGVRFEPSNKLVAEKSDLVILAVKPVIYPQVLAEIRDVMGGRKILVSFAPGISIADLTEKLGGFDRIVRCMPNTPAKVGEGMTGVSYDETKFTGEEQERIGDIFRSFGRMVKVEERLMDAVTTVSGSSPAFVFLFINALADAGVRYGLRKSDAIEMAAQTVLGSAKLVLETKEHPEVLKDQVCSPAGTTIEAVAALEEAGFRSAVLKGADACYRKCIGK